MLLITMCFTYRAVRTIAGAETPGHSFDGSSLNPRRTVFWPEGIRAAPDISLNNLADSSDVKFWRPSDVAVHPMGTVAAVADTYNNQIRALSLTTEEVRIIAGSGRSGMMDGSSTMADFSEPSGLAFSQDGIHLYISDSDNNCIRQIQLGPPPPPPPPPPTEAPTAVPTPSKAPTDGGKRRLLTVTDPFSEKHNFPSSPPPSPDTDGHKDHMNLYFSGVNPVTTIAGNSSAGGMDGDSTKLLTDVTFNRPMGLATYEDCVFIADSLSHSIRVLNTTTSVVFTLAGNGKPGYNNGIGVKAMFHTPEGVAVSPDGAYVFVADTYNHRIRQIHRLSKVVSTIAGDGVPRYRDGFGTSPDAALTSGSLYSPMSVDVCPNGHCVVVGDHHNQRVRIIDIGNAYDVPTTPNGLITTRDSHRYNVTNMSTADTNAMMKMVKLDLYTAAIRTLAGSGSNNKFDGPGSKAGFKGPAGVSIRPQGDYVLVADREANTIRKITLEVGVPGLPSAPLLYGVSPTSLTISWAAAMGVPFVDRYEIRYRGRPTIREKLQWVSSIRLAQLGTAYYRPSATVYDLKPNERYGMQVRAGNQIGWGPWSLESVFTTSNCGNVPLKWIHSDGSSHTVGHDMCKDEKTHNEILEHRNVL